MADILTCVVLRPVDCSPGFIATCVWIAFDFLHPIKTMVRNINDIPMVNFRSIRDFFIIINSGAKFFYLVDNLIEPTRHI